METIRMFGFQILACVHMHTHTFILRMFTTGMHFLMADTDYSKYLFILNTIESSHKLGHSGGVKANSSIL